MEPIKFKEHNVVYAEDQPEYLPLPVLKLEDGEVISCWKLNFIEKMKILLFGKLWLSILTFNKSLQPLLPSVSKPFLNRR